MAIKIEFEAGSSSKGPSITQVPEDPMISSDLWRHHMHMVHRHVLRQDSHIHKINLKKKENYQIGLTSKM